ncbi:MAG: hypothetical protein IKQ97_09775 [Eubacterium sp.]|nr:hypothetical protein [Eubacterium sp.]
MKRESVKRLTAMTLAATLAFSGALSTVKPAGAATADMTIAAEATSGSSATASGSAVAYSFAPTKEGLQELVKGNSLLNVKPSRIMGARVEFSARNDDRQEMLIKKAQEFKKENGKDTKYQLYDMNKDGVQELFLNYPSGVRGGLAIGRYDFATYGGIILKKLNGVNEVFQGKKQIVVLASNGGKSFEYITYKLTENGKLKKVVSYKKDGNQYKKNKKKISKKVFNKYAKSLKKLKKMKFKKVPNTEIPAMKDKATTYLSKDLYFNTTYYDEYYETTVMKRDDNAEMAQNKRLAFSMTYDKIGKEYSSDPAVKRYVFGPDVNDPKTGKTYQAEDWNWFRGSKFGIEFACPMLSMAMDDNGKFVDSTLETEDIKKLETAEDEFTMNGEKDTTMVYYFSYGDTRVTMRFFKTGKYAGLPQSVERYLPSTKDDIPVEEWLYWYGEASNYDGQAWDPVVTAQVEGTAVKAGIPGAVDRVLTINTTNDAKLAPYQQIIVTNKNVAFELFSEDFGQFYTFKDDGTTKWNLPLKEEDDKEQKMIDDMLNPSDGQLTYRQPNFAKGLFWEPK